jgi:beta-lactamase class A
MTDQLLWNKLQATLQAQIANFSGVAGIAIQDLKGGLQLAIHGDELFPTASTIKVPILMQLLRRAQAGELDLQERIRIEPAMQVGGSGVLTYLDGPVELTLLDMANLMIIASDNTATNLCLERAGLEATNSLLHELGLAQIIVRRQMMDHLAAVREQENVATPSALATIFALLHGGAPSAAVATQTLAILQKPKQGFLDRALPPGVAFASKPGWVERACCDAGLVYLSRRPYTVAIMTKYALCDTESQQRFVVDCAQTIHATMDILDKSNSYGRSIYES